mmetsp:Transcript_3796/g.4368  ORF Transcript_3796/g.4368 Transcript_3796/m.4368 type:complete len:243 (+) Transcript_3796:77-805(+)
MTDSPVLVLGATGRIGSQVVKQLLDRGFSVRAIVRNAEKFQSQIGEHKRLSVKAASVLDIPDYEYADEVKSSKAVVSCLGHGGSFQGIFGHPRFLCRDAVKKTLKAVQQNEIPSKFILVNTVLVDNPQGDTKRGMFERFFLGMLEFLIPPAHDNKAAAQYLSNSVGTDSMMKWVSVRPCGLKETEASNYDIHARLFTSAFSYATVSIPNVAHFMCELVENDDTWTKWEGQMPIVVDREDKEN